MMRPSVGAHQFRHTMSQLAGGVTIVMVRDAAGRAQGMTASAVASLSLEPPMLLVCIDHAAAIHDLVAAADVFGVNVLAASQADLAQRFADRERHHYAEHQGDVSPAGLPLVPGALAHIDVRREAVLPGGDHSIITGQVTWSETGDGAPLLYFRSSYLSTP